MKTLERVFKWADKQLRKGLEDLLNCYPNNFYTGELKVSVNVDKEEVDHCGGVFCPEDNEIVINKYALPIVANDKQAEVINLFKDKKRLRHVVLHELIHYAFTEYIYSEDNEKPVGWTVGLCTEENTASHVEKEANKKWKTDEWLDEVLTERLTMHFSGWAKTGMPLYQNNISEDDMDTFKLVKDKLINGSAFFDDIVNALYHHDKNIFLKYI